jgi:hypothetical protein
VECLADEVVRPESSPSRPPIIFSLKETDRQTNLKGSNIPFGPISEIHQKVGATRGASSGRTFLVSVDIVFELIMEAHVVHFLEDVEVWCFGGPLTSSTNSDIGFFGHAYEPRAMLANLV